MEFKTYMPSKLISKLKTGNSSKMITNEWWIRLQLHFRTWSVNCIANGSMETAKSISETRDTTLLFIPHTQTRDCNPRSFSTAGGSAPEPCRWMSKRRSRGRRPACTCKRTWSDWPHSFGISCILLAHTWDCRRLHWAQSRPVSTVLVEKKQTEKDK